MSQSKRKMRVPCVYWICLALLEGGALSNVQEQEFTKIGDGQCNGGVGGTGQHKCLVGGACNEGGEPLAPPTVNGTGCPGASEYLLCTEESINISVCGAACQTDAACAGFMLSSHAAAGKARCELHTKKVGYVAKPLECYTCGSNVCKFIGYGACRTKSVTLFGPQNGTLYGNMHVEWVSSLAHCQRMCRESLQPCVGIEYHGTARVEGDFKCEIHFEELSADQMSLFECWVPSMPLVHQEIETVGSLQTEGMSLLVVVICVGGFALFASLLGVVLWKQGMCFERRRKLLQTPEATTVGSVATNDV